MHKDVSQDLEEFRTQIAPLIGNFSLLSKIHSDHEMLLKLFSKLFEELTINFCNSIKNLISSTSSKILSETKNHDFTPEASFSPQRIDLGLKNLNSNSASSRYSSNLESKLDMSEYPTLKARLSSAEKI